MNFQFVGTASGPEELSSALKSSKMKKYLINSELNYNIDVMYKFSEFIQK